ncbi:Mg2 transporter protein CorA family protein [Arcobacter nitrofigilis DSM 7299]|uniref:Mg2 transporter protein CorA family protein n=1 Tax=Arcobacter nitrofigilis (strain ATCC 33309 / DSM 7299 / CCUG 15893 / LMG 7604 / NCTC 12251 / CI) TaxID=572480 RepID=D5V2R4_ARCNC|nr:Mg2 transporter protein CorA family protein [Arcobacter nitrofigilis]ADG92496.1 Mg2 transporter protein CorA family protein [Arcobacter nitrofigilis DSM 7299]
MKHNEINNFHISDIENEVHPSIFIKDEDYDLFILRIPQIINDKLIPVSKAFIITDKSYFYFDKENKDFVDLKNIDGFYKYLNNDIDSILNIVTSYMSEIEQIEDDFYDNKIDKNFNKQWFSYKNDFIKMNRVLFKCAEVMNILISNYNKDDDYLKRNFEDLQEHLHRAHRNSGMLLEKIDALHNSYIIENNEQMNRTVYILTLLSGIFLPLNLIVGFFGMNTTSLPFSKTDDGTFLVINVLFISVIISTILIYFIKKR